MVAFLFLLRWPWNGAGCRSVSRYSWASAAGWQRDICCQGRGLLRTGGGQGGEERSRLWCLLFRPDLESYNESSICKKNQLFGKEVVAAAKVLSLLQFSFTGFQRKWLGPGVFHLGSTQTSFRWEAGNGRSSRSNKTRVQVQILLSLIPVHPIWTILESLLLYFSDISKEHSEGDTYIPKSIYLPVSLSIHLSIYLPTNRYLYFTQLSKLRPNRYLPSSCYMSVSARFNATCLDMSQWRWTRLFQPHSQCS